ncbi:MAG: alpha/beta hydrolase [Rhodospirillales bacterium]|nr:alpha/beta hydrolase [Rhodospirillales bacterium]
MTTAVAPSSFRERFFTSQDGLRLYVRDYGEPRRDQPTLLCLPGVTRNSKDFHRLATRLASSWRVLCPDYRGRGASDSDPDWWNYQPRTYLDDIRHLLVAFNIRRGAIIGTSLGGILAMAMAVVFPTMVAGAALNDIGPTLESRGLGNIVTYMKDDRPMADWPAAVLRLRTTFPDLPAKTDADWLMLARMVYREDSNGRVVFGWDQAIVKPILRGVPLSDLWPLFSALGDRPTLVLRGARSSVLSEDTVQRMKAKLPALRSVTVPDVGHTPALTEPEAETALDEFLARL